MAEGHAHLHGSIRKVCGFTQIRLGERVEEGRLSDVGKTDDTDLVESVLLDLSLTFKLFPGLPSTVFFSSPTFFLGGILRLTARVGVE
jgi:hypothetical protein